MLQLFVNQFVDIYDLRRVEQVFLAIMLETNALR